MIFLQPRCDSLTHSTASSLQSSFCITIKMKCKQLRHDLACEVALWPSLCRSHPAVLFQALLTPLLCFLNPSSPLPDSGICLCCWLILEYWLILTQCTCSAFSLLKAFPFDCLSHQNVYFPPVVIIVFIFSFIVRHPYWPFTLLENRDSA